jgi:hypothetical protein
MIIMRARANKAIAHWNDPGLPLGDSEEDKIFHRPPLLLRAIQYQRRFSGVPT